MNHRVALGLLSVLGAFSGCTCTVDSTPKPNPNPTPSTPEGACYVASATPDFGARDVPVAGGSFTLSYTDAIDPATLAGHITLERQNDGTTVDVDITTSDDHTVVVTPKEELAFFSDYSLHIDAGIASLQGTPCAEDGIAVSTLSPTEAPTELRPYPITSVSIVGNHALVASGGGRALQTYSLAGGVPTLVSTTPLAGSPTALAVSGNRAYVPVGFDGVVIVDITDIEGPKVLGVAGTPWYAQDVVPFSANGSDYIAVADGPGGARIIDVTKAEGAKDVSNVNPSNAQVPSVTSLALNGNMLAVGEEQNGFSLVDISNLQYPSVVAHRNSQPVPETYNTTASVNDVLFSGNNLYVSLRFRGIQSFDLTIPSSPAFIQHYLGPQGLCSSGCPDDMGSLAIDGGYLYATSAMTGAVRLPLDPTGAFHDPVALDAKGRINALAVDASSLWIAGERGLTSFGKLADAGAAPTYEEAKGWGFQRGVTLVGDHLFTVSSSVGLEGYGLAAPLAPNRTSRSDTPGVERDFGLAGVIDGPAGLFVADGRAGFSIFDIGTPDAPTLIGSSDPVHDTVAGIVPGNGYALMCDGNIGLLSYDLTNPASPQKTATLALNDQLGGCLDLTRADDTVYVAGGKALGIVDVTTPGAPVLDSVLALPADDRIGSIERSGNYLYATSFAFDWEGGYLGDRRLYVFDITDKKAPKRVYKSPDLGASGRVVIRGTKAFMPGGKHGIYVFDVKDPTDPVLEGTIDTEGSAASLAFDKETLYVSRGGAGLGAIHVGTTQ